MLLQGAKVDFSHRINHLSFGSEENIKEVKKQAKVKNLAPLDGHSELSRPDAHGGGHAHYSFTTYYLTVTPGQYNIDGNEYMVHEFTHSEQTIQSHHYPAIFFRFQLSPVFVNYEISQMTFLAYFIRLCAIIGGVYTTAGMLEGIWHSVTSPSKED